MERITITDEAILKLQQLDEVLFDKGYFLSRETARKYVNAIIDFIYTIPTQRRYATRRKRYGLWYCRYKPNRHTTWFVTFDTDETVWIVRNVINNHTAEYPTYIKGTD